MQGRQVHDELVQSMSGKGVRARCLEPEGSEALVEQSDYVICPHCGKKVVLAKRNRLGRKPLNIGVKNVCGTLRDCRDIALAAEKLSCSRGYIYKVLGEHGLKPGDVIRRQILDSEK
jgi:DNA-directed RNA polymerase subunit RPC12/RpoP